MLARGVGDKVLKAGDEVGEGVGLLGLFVEALRCSAG